MKTKRIRKRLSDRKWLKRRLEELMKESIEINNFLDFRCNKHFVGSTVAEHNRKIWRQDYHRNERKIKFIQSLLTKEIK